MPGHYSRLLTSAVSSVLNLQLDLVRIGLEFRRVHGPGLGRQGAELAGDLGAHAVADAVLAAGEGADEEDRALVAELDVGAHVVAVVSAAQVHRLEAGGFRVLEHDVLVVVLAFDLELDLDEVAALEHRQVGEFLALVLLGPLVHGLAARAFGLDGLGGFDELVVLALHLDFEAGAGDRVFEREVRQVCVEVERAGAFLDELDGVLAVGERLAFQDELVVEGEDVLRA